jgi:acetyltransferase-like isoleucine patch superfamily enzyme
VEFGLDVSVGNNSDLYHCRIGNHTKIKHFVEIQGDVIIGQFCKIESYVFIPEGTRIGNYVFVGPGVIFTNDKNPRATGAWKMAPVTVQDNVIVGANATILPGVVLGEGCRVGAGAVVTRPVEPRTTVVGNPARQHPWEEI